MHRLTDAAALLLALSASGYQSQPFDVTEKSISELVGAMSARRVTSRQLTAMYLARIDAYDKRGPVINAMIARNPHALGRNKG